MQSSSSPVLLEIASEARAAGLSSLGLASACADRPVGDAMAPAAAAADTDADRQIERHEAVERFDPAVATGGDAAGAAA